VSLAERIKLSFINQNAPLSCCRKYSSLFLEEKIQCCPLYCSLPPSVLCQRLGQIMVLKDHSLISLFVHFGEGIWVQNKSWNLDLAFWKQKLFWCESKIICFWNLATPWLFSFLEKRLFALVFGKEVFWWKYVMRWPFCFQSEGLEKKLEVLFEKNLSLFEHSFLLAWIIMSSLFLMSWILWKVFFAFWEPCF